VYCGNNPINYLDDNGKFQFPAGSNYQRDYPIFAAIVEHMIPQLAENTAVVSALSKASNLDASSIKEKLQFGEGPVLEVAKSSGTWIGMTSEKDKPSLISEGFVKGDLEAQRKEYEPKQAVYNALMLITVLHEGANAFNLQASKRNSFNSGVKFEKLLFKEDIGGNVKKVEQFFNTIQAIFKINFSTQKEP
jgi:hypothetical protein